MKRTRDKDNSHDKPQVSFPHSLKLGELVRYYDDGWRWGHLESVDKGSATIRPIAPLVGTVRNIHTPVIDVWPALKWLTDTEYLATQYRSIA